MKKTIGILAHVDAGKTTFSEQILYHTNSIRNRGRVDHKDSFLDSHSIERERGITVFSDQGIFEFNNSKYYLVDTPGHIDFSTEMERAIEIMDYAIIVISAVEGVQGHTQTVWNLLRKYNVSTIFFINKLDRVGADKDRVIKEIKKDLTKDICYLENDSLGLNNNFSEELIEFISEYDDELLERYLEGNYDFGIWLNTFKILIKEGKVFPCFGGSALKDEGIVEFLNVFDKLSFTKYDEGKEFSGRVYKIRHDENGNRITFIKALSGTLKIRDEVKYGGELKEESNLESTSKYINETCEKISSIRIYNGSKFKPVDIVKAGDLFAISGLSKAVAGDGVGTLKEKTHYEMIPTLMSKVIFDNTCNVREILGYFKILEAEDNALNIIWNEALQEIHVHIMGKIQLEVLKEIVQERFNLSVEFGPCQILYKETIEGETIGCGHFEPLRHYAEVHLKLEPLPRNSGIVFENKCHSDDLTFGNQNLVKTHIFEREHHGLLTGASITDIRVTLLTGRAHNKHTCGGDFREATFRALRQGLEKVKNILLEPYYKFVIEISSEHIGRVLSDIQRLNGIFEPAEIEGDRARISGRGPVATFMDYSMEVIAFTKGKGSINLMYDGYDVCHNSEEVIQNKGYKKNADIEYTSTSVFCSHGQAYLVPWDEADEAMHCEVNI
ncbi:TetM/TetW/TetO/TetS family tetracycline resistance ribosomal protection protein [Clostridium sp. BL-8]|uniref:elongation factor G n=1 Tax=Clostridium sp. BL-8 TaxID=349938 RepID=UPI00098BF96F|nr:TetM/TetW/TetO/TetS family tetracycline resistance ribosomal protection protein [Clostridium sp. BL-8]OOM77990.1 tetracycline resistance protein TetM from transposon TnFO1 [Clostridium sp. BL-8]